MASKAPRVFDVRPGDTWVFRSNDWVCVRYVVSVGPWRIEFADGGERQQRRSILISSFKRWWRGAGLESATDWNGRESSGETLDPKYEVKAMPRDRDRFVKEYVARGRT